MIKTKAIGTLVLVLAGLLALGALSALAGGRARDHDRAAAEHDTGDDGDQAVVAQEEGEPGQGAQAVAQVIADEFGVSQEQVLALHEQGIGYGALFKLYAIARARNLTNIEQLLAEMGFSEDGEHAFAFGEMRKGLSVEAQAALESGPKNLGQLVSESHKAGGGGEAEAAAQVQGNGRAFDQGQGPPEFAKAHGRR